MNTIETPGIHPKWGKKSKSIRSGRDKWMGLQKQPAIDELEHYVRHGYTSLYKEEASNPRKQPDDRWGSYLPAKLSILGMISWCEQEKRDMIGASFDTNLALDTFSAIYTRQMIDLYKHAMSSLLSNDQNFRYMISSELPFTALGVVIGCKKEAFNLARLQLRAYRKHYYSSLEGCYPIYHFMLRLLADYLGEPPLVLTGAPLAEPIFQRLFDLWREPVADTLLPVCLAACDFHTHRWVSMGDGEFTNEFSDTLFAYTPIEILLLFKLRQLIGLPNPVVDHPLMRTSLGVLPEEVAFEPSDLIKRGCARMMQDGYNESTISKLYDVEFA